MKRRINFIGPCGNGQIPSNGASIKNMHILNFFRKKEVHMNVIDTENWRKRPWVLLNTMFRLLLDRHAVFILSMSSGSVYRLLSILSYIACRRDIIYWVIGGDVANKIENKKYSVKPYKILRYIIVEGDRMKDRLIKNGLENVITVPNFKDISYLPKRKYADDKYLRFVFISRIIPKKGCDYILEAVSKLNLDFENLFSVHFYGPVDDGYKCIFNDKVDRLPNVSYEGFLDLRNVTNYDILSSYDCLLFPTFWDSEGFPGVIIDAYIAGLPVIASDWNLNSDILKDNVTGIIIAPKDVDALYNAMKTVILHRKILEQMSYECQKIAMNYDINNVLTDKLLNTLEL